MSQLAGRVLKKARLVNSSSADFPTWVSAEVDPPWGDAGTAAGRVLERIALSSGGGMTPRSLIIYPYGLGGDNNVFDLRVIGYRRIVPKIASAREFYVRFFLAKLTCTISAAVGLASAGGDTYPILDTERFADTIAVGIEGTYTAATTREGSIDLYSPANDSPGHVIVPLLGVEGYELEWDQTTATPTMNALVSYLDAPSKQP